MQAEEEEEEIMLYFKTYGETTILDLNINFNFRFNYLQNCWNSLNLKYLQNHLANISLPF
jgi:hypothetical protein